MFQTEAEKHLGFLTDEHGFRLAKSEPCQVRFESPDLFVEMVFDNARSYELDLLVGQMDSEEPSFTIAQIVRQRDQDAAAALSGVQVTTTEGLEKWIGRLAEALRQYGGELISGDQGAFARLADQRASDSAQYILEMNLRTARTVAEMAWRERDYDGFAAALKPYRHFLTATEASKLEYAGKRLAGRDNT